MKNIKNASIKQRIKKKFLINQLKKIIKKLKVISKINNILKAF